MSLYKLKKEYKGKTTIVVSEGQGFKIDSDFFNRYANAHVLIQSRKEIGHFFTDADGKPVNDAEKPVKDEVNKTETKRAKKSDSKQVEKS